MDDIRVLEEIGLKEVSQKTHIEVKYLKSLISSDFKSLSKVTALGFIKIISREYKLDLSDWIDEANAYWDSIEESEEKPKIFIIEKPKIFPKFVISFIFLIILMAILYGAYIFLNHKLNFFDKPVVKNDTNYTYDQTPVVNKAKKNLNISEASLNASIAQEDINVSEQNIIKITDKNISDINQSLSVSKQGESKVEHNASQLVDLNQTFLSENNNTDSFISPNAKLWIGIIYLDNFKRKSYLGDGNFTLDSSRDQLITTGHGDLNLYFKGVLKKFKSRKPMKFLIKDGNISEISINKFKELNKGSLW
jgi:cytoskeletal protein RodZ